MARMAEVKCLGDIFIDSIALAPSDMRGGLLDALGLDKAPLMPVHIVSFSYRYGIPETADQGIDMRFAKNPHWDDGLRDQTGLDSKVAEFLAKDEMAIAFLDQVKSMLVLMLSRMNNDGRAHLTLAFGCTGGKHRSVWAAAQIASWIEAEGHPVRLEHRELAKASA